MKNIKKILLLLLIAICTFTIMATKANAECISCGSGGNPGSSTPPPSSTPVPGQNYDGDPNDNLKCNYTSAGSYSYPYCGIAYANNYTSDVYADLYDKFGKYIGNALSEAFKKKTFKAGTYVGMDVYEEFKMVSTVTISPGCTGYTVTLTCSCEKCKWYPAPCPTVAPKSKSSAGTGGNGSRLVGGGLRAGRMGYAENEDGTVTQIRIGNDCGSWGPDSYTETSGSCKSGYSAEATCRSSSCAAPSDASCLNSARKYLVGVNKNEDEHYTAMMRDVNDANNDIETKVTPYKEHFDETKEYYRKLVRTSYLRVKYNPQKACINIKTAKVRYVDFDSKCNADTEMAVKSFYNENNEQIGTYFIPLNTKTNYNYDFELKAKSKISGYKADMCTNIINKYAKDGRWRVLLLDSSGKAFSANESVASGLSRVKDGCYYAFVIKFNIEQDFYNETGSTNALKILGYDNYYRPINYTNPFPNGISKNSYWKDLYNSKTNEVKVTDITGKVKTYDLDDSFKEISYAIDITNANAIREYNKNNFYTSWKEMNKNGSSSFIDGKYKVKSNDYYKIGCGPTNSDWEECRQ